MIKTLLSSARAMAQDGTLGGVSMVTAGLGQLDGLLEAKMRRLADVEECITLRLQELRRLDGEISIAAESLDTYREVLAHASGAEEPAPDHNCPRDCVPAESDEPADVETMFPAADTRPLGMVVPEQRREP